MSPHPLDNPYRKRTPPTKSESGVIGSLLGDAAKTAFEAVGGSTSIENDDEYFLDEGSEETGKRLQREADNVLERDGKWTRKRYVIWAESFGKNEDWVDENFEFQDDGTTITRGSIDLSGKGLTELPKGWVRVERNCDLNRNKLTSLIGAPESVEGDFYCRYNLLSSLAGAPKSVGMFFSCSNNQLTSLIGAPENVGGDFYCLDNQLTSLIGAPENVGGDFWCSFNRLTSLDELPDNINGMIYARNNPLMPEAIARAKAKWKDKHDLKF